MASGRIWSILPLLLLLAAFIGSIGLVSPAHASTNGVVCLQSPSSVAVSSGKPCSGAAPTFDGPAPGGAQASPTQIRMGVYVNSSAALNGFDITLIANHTVLRPAGVDTTGTVVPGTTSVIVECLGTALVSGSRCATTDTVDTLHFALLSFNLVTTAPTTGLLFTAVFNITGTATATGFAVGFQTGCNQAATSVPPLCVTISNPSSTTPDPESVQTGAFNNHTPPPWVAVSSNSSSLTFFTGGSTGNHASITGTGQNLWPGGSTDSVSFLTPVINGLSPVFSPSSCATMGSSCSTVMSLNGFAGNYMLSVRGQYVLTDPTFPGQTDTLDGPLLYQVTVRDFNLTVSPTRLSVNAGLPSSSSITLASLNGFSNPVFLSAVCQTYSSPWGSLTGGGRGVYFMFPIGQSCPAMLLSQSTFMLSGGASLFSSLNFSSLTTPGNYSYLVIGQSAAGTVHTATVILVVRDFNLTASPSYLAFDVASSSISTVTVKSLDNFAGTVALSAKSYPSGLTVSFVASSLTLTAGGVASTTITISAPVGTSTGSYVLQITGVGGGISHTYNILIQIRPQGFTAVLTRVLSQPGVTTLLGLGFLGVALPFALIQTRARAGTRSRRAKRSTIAKSRVAWSRVPVLTGRTTTTVLGPPLWVYSDKRR